MFASPNSSKRLFAVCGKGGVGKTAFTVMMTRCLIENKKAGKLLLIDADPAMGLPMALGINVGRTMGQIREEIIWTNREGNKGEQRQLRNRLDYMVLQALFETDNFALLSMGRSETVGCFCPVNYLLRDTIETLSQSFDTIVIDGEAGLEQINRQVIRHVDVLLVISDATSRGLQTATLIKNMVQIDRVIQCEKMGLIFNRVQCDSELLKQSARDIGIEVFGYIPHDENIMAQDLVGRSLLELPDSSSALTAVRNIIGILNL